jgi:anti-sigma factor RsiW
MSCRLSRLDGCYVLGALSTTEHSEFERHLLHCVECSSSVNEIAGLPALLALVRVADAGRQADDPPRTLLPGLVRRVRRFTRRRAAPIATLADA